MNVFKDLKVVELASVLAGPAVGTFFSELGANVLKIENTTTQGDVTRTWKLPNEGSGVSAYYSSANYNKQIMFLDLTHKEDREKLRTELKNTDVLITNFKHNDDVKFNLTYGELKQLFPQLIVCQIKGFASEPDRVAYDVVMQAESGFMSMNGTAESGPTKMPVALIDLLAAHQAKQGILTALLNKAKTNKGCYVTVTLEESAIASLVNQASNYLMAHHVPTTIGSLHPNIAPYGEIFDCKYGKKVVLSIGSDKQFNKLCKLLLLENNDTFRTNQVRVLNREALWNFLETGFRRFSREEIMEEAIEQKIPIGAIKDMAEVFENEVAQQMILNEKIENTNTKRVATVAFRIEE